MKTILRITLLIATLACIAYGQSGSGPNSPSQTSVSSKDLEDAVATGILKAAQVPRPTPGWSDYWRTLWQQVVFTVIPLAFAFYLSHRLAQAHGPLRIRFGRRISDAELERMYAERRGHREGFREKV